MKFPSSGCVPRLRLSLLRPTHSMQTLPDRLQGVHRCTEDEERQFRKSDGMWERVKAKSEDDMQEEDGLRLRETILGKVHSSWSTSLASKAWCWLNFKLVTSHLDYHDGAVVKHGNLKPGSQRIHILRTRSGVRVIIDNAMLNSVEWSDIAVWKCVNYLLQKWSMIDKTEAKISQESNTLRPSWWSRRRAHPVSGNSPFKLHHLKTPESVRPFGRTPESWSRTMGSPISSLRFLGDLAWDTTQCLSAAAFWDNGRCHHIWPPD